MQRKNLTDDQLSQAELYAKMTVNRAIIDQMPLTLTNLMNSLSEFFNALNQLKQYDLIIAIGNTGCGKSTMITSLVNGPDSLEIRNVQ